MLTMLPAMAVPKPSCAELNASWPRYVEDLGIRLKYWSGGSVKCPSREAALASALYYLEELRIVRGSDRMDCYRYVADRTYVTVPTNDHASNATTMGGLNIGTSFSSLTDATINGAETLVHEAYHMGLDGAVHVKCKPHLKVKTCDEKFRLMLNPAREFNRPDIGAMSASVSYLVDIYRHAELTEEEKRRVRFRVRDRIENNFVPGAVSVADKRRVFELLDIKP